MRIEMNRQIIGNIKTLAIKKEAGLARSHARRDAASTVQQELKSRVDEPRTYSAGAGEAPTFR